jgi:hypothetical protein
MNRQQVKNQSSYFDASPKPCNQPFAEETASDPGLLRWRWINHLRGLAINASLNWVLSIRNPHSAAPVLGQK